MTNSSEYDLIVSLGGSCSVSMQLRHRGKRLCSFPLDWTLMIDERPVHYLSGAFRNKFADYCLRENLREFEPPMEEYGRMSHRVEDSVSGFRLIHQFHASLDDEAAFARERAVIDKRIDRLYRMVSRSKRVLFALETLFTFEDKLAEDILDALQESFPGVEIEMYVMQFSSPDCRRTVLRDGKLIINRYERQKNIVYDNQFTAPEWSWMDNLVLTGVPTAEQLRKMNLWVKLRYKLWMWLGKSLNEDGAGCANMRFRHFPRYH